MPSILPPTSLLCSLYADKACLLVREHSSEAQLLKEVLGKLGHELGLRERLLTGYEVGLEEQVAQVKHMLVDHKVTAFQ